MVDELPEWNHRQLVARLAIDLEGQPPRGRPFRGALELQEELQDSRAGGRGQRVGLGGGVVAGTEQQAGVEDRLVAPQHAISQIESPAGPQLGFEPRGRHLGRHDLDAGGTKRRRRALGTIACTSGIAGYSKFSLIGALLSSLRAAATSIFASQRCDSSGLTPGASA